MNRTRSMVDCCALQHASTSASKFLSTWLALNLLGSSTVTLSSVDPAMTAPPNHASNLSWPILLRRGAPGAPSPSGLLGAFAREGLLNGLVKGLSRMVRHGRTAPCGMAAPLGAAWSSVV